MPKCPGTQPSSSWSPLISNLQTSFSTTTLLILEQTWLEAGNTQEGRAFKITGHISEHDKCNNDKHCTRRGSSSGGKDQCFSKMSVIFNWTEQITPHCGFHLKAAKWKERRRGFNERPRSATRNIRTSLSMQTRDIAMHKYVIYFLFGTIGKLYLCLPRGGKKQASTTVRLSQIPVAGPHNCTKDLLLSAVRTPCVFELA